MEPCYVYILASKPRGTLYVGVTKNLERRLFEHRNKVVSGFTEKYAVHKLVYFEETPDIRVAIEREKRLKHWLRQWKIELIEKTNPAWRDLAEDFGFSGQAGE